MKHPLWTVGLAVLAIAPGSAWAAGVTDHLACYKIKDSAAKAAVSGLAVQAGCTIKLPAVLTCTPASKTNVAPAPPGGGGIGTPNGFTCYKVKCPKVPKGTFTAVTVTDQFGSRGVTPTTMQLVCAPDSGPTDGGFPATGQTTCWDSSGNVIQCSSINPFPPPAFLHTGHDGDTRTGAPLSYVDNGDGTITDVNTGLMWEKQSRDGSIHDDGNRYTWDQAFSVHVATLNSTSFAGHTDWRVPNVRELMSINDYENFSPSVSPAFNTSCTASCTVLTCSCTPSNHTWSSSTSAIGPTFAWFVDFNGGVVDAGDKSALFTVRAVRGGS
jgi:hypothetical protein